jgi:hypothetical protein
MVQTRYDKNSFPLNQEEVPAKERALEFAIRQVFSMQYELNTDILVTFLNQVYDIKEVPGVHTFQKVLVSPSFMVDLTPPTDGTEGVYKIRADFPDTFTSWGNALFQDTFTEVDAMATLYSLLKFFTNRYEIIKQIRMQEKE